MNAFKENMPKKGNAGAPKGTRDNARNAPIADVEAVAGTPLDSGSGQIIQVKIARCSSSNNVSEAVAWAHAFAKTRVKCFHCVALSQLGTYLYRSD